ncbi:MAG: hypothetical protein V1767_04485 [Chloroflexota bacterium]
MEEQEKQSLKETERREKRIEFEAELIAKEQVRKKAYLAREEAIEKTSKANETKRAEKRAREEIEQLSKDQARRQALFAKEQAIAEAQEARKAKG